MDRDEQVVFSAGNSWIVCRSKSHCGRIYYFNTLTGEAAWNLNSAEIEKAKTRTKTLSKQDNINIEGCPEPKEPPTDQAKEMSVNNQASPSTSTIYNKQIINNRFPKPSYSMTPVVIPPYNHLVANQLNTIMPLALNTQEPGYNTRVWAVPPTHQIFIGPTISPLVNQGQTTAVNFEYNNQNHTVTQQVTSTSLSKRFTNLPTRGFNTKPSKKYHRKCNFTSPTSNKRFNDRNCVYQNSYKRNLRTNDLRQVLSARKREWRASSSVEHEKDKEETFTMDDLSGYTSESEVNVKNEEKYKEKDDGNNADSDWIEENILVEDSRLKLNISNLKKMAKPGMDPDCWYIVADKDILLYHLYFLNTLCNSDDNCCLMVAQGVLAELRELSHGSPAAGDARRARRAVCFLHKQLDDGYVVIGDGTCGENGTRSDYLLDCCSNLLEENYHVILLSNDDELNSYKNSSSIPIFNIKEIKQFLTKSEPVSQEHNSTKQAPETKTYETKKTDRLKPPPCLKKPMPQSPKRPIKITVANDFVHKSDDNLNACEVNRETKFNRDVENACEINKETPYNRDVTNASEVNKKTQIIRNLNLANACEVNKETHLNKNVANTCKVNRTVANAFEVDKDTQFNRDIINADEGNKESIYNSDVTNACEVNKETQFIRNVANACDVNNDTQFNRDITNADEDNKETQFESDAANVCKVNKEIHLNGYLATVDECNETAINKSEVDHHLIDFNLPKKITSEAAVQTEMEIVNEPSVSNDNQFIFTKICGTDDREKILVQEKEVNKTALSAESARKEIRLNRSISVKTTTSSEDAAGGEKKQFKWRRRRYASGTTANDSKMSSVTSSNVDENSRDSVNAQKSALIEQQPSQKNDESVSSETSSLLIIRNLFNDSVVIEETSNSGIISNSTVDSESENGNKLSSSMLSNPKQKIEPLTAIMYKVTDKEMEDSLRIMNDEWISRFTQIMEEVLTQVLRKDERFLVNVVYKLHGGGPWTIWEAAECIKIKFSNDYNIVDAATKLTNVYKRISDNTGRIAYNLEPAEYMELYSLGVYLVAGLARARRGCEDVAGAARALAALLADIRSPERGLAQDSFGEPAVDSVPCARAVSEPGKEITKSTDEVHPVKSINEVAKPQGTSAANSSRKVGERSYNLRSRNKSQQPKERENKKEENVKFIRKFDVQDSFFNSLNLIKKTANDTSSTKLICSTQVASSDPEEASRSQGWIRSIFDRNLNGCNEESNKTSSGTEATVIRKFTVFPEYENNLRKNVVREPLDMDQLDYTAMFDESDNFMNEEYYSDEECYENGHDSQVNEDDVKVSRERRASIENYSRNGSALSEDLPVVRNSRENVFFNIGDNRQFSSPLNINNKLNTIFSTIITRVKEAFLDVELFCKETSKELSESQVHSIRRKYEINESAVKTQVLLDNLCKSLNSILHRENYEFEKNIQSLLKEEGINNFNLHDNLLNQYRDVIGKCIEQAGVLQESVTLILSVIKKQPIE